MEGTSAEVRAGTTSGQNAPDRVRAFCRSKPEETWGGQAGDVQLSGLHPHLWTSLEERQVPRVAQEYPKATPCQVETGKGRAQEAHASATGGSREMVEERDTGLLQLSCRSRKLRQSPALSA